MRTSREWGEILTCGEPVRYEILTVDARAGTGRGRSGALGGNVIVVVPGHGQTVAGPRRLVTEFALQSQSKVAWCIDPTPTVGGDCTEARALAQIVRDRLACIAGSTGRLTNQATIVGWSHGGGEALRAAREDPDLFPHYLGLCPVGLVERQPAEMIASFVVEATSVVAGDLLHGRWANVGETLRVGADFARGLALDLVRSRSIRCVIDDICWACRQVPGPHFDYPGEVILLLSTHDRVIRWRDAFPGCDTPDQLAALVPAFQQACFPCSRRLDVRLVAGNHMTPELEPSDFVRPGLGLVGQLA